MLERKIIGMAPSVRLGMIRFVICAAALVSVCMERLAAFSEVSSAWMRPAGFLKWIPAHTLSAFTESALYLFLFQAVLIIVLVLAAAGLFTRVSLIISALLYLLYAGLLRSYGTYFSQGIVTFYLLFFLSFLPCGEDFSLDRRWKQSRGLQPDLQPRLSAGWAIFLLRAVIALTYFQSGWAKLHYAGTAWLEPGNLKRILMSENLSLMTYSGGIFEKCLHWPEPAWNLLGSMVFFMELLFPVVLISWGIRKIYPVFAGAIFLALALLCPPLILDGVTSLCLLLVFYDWDRIFLRHLLPAQDRRRQIPPAETDK